MNELQLSLEKFDFDKFVKDMTGFAHTVFESGLVMYITDSEDIPELIFEENKEIDFLAELKGGRQLYFTFSNTNIGEPISCADGTKHIMLEEEEEGGMDEICLGESDAVGYLVSLNNDELIIKPSMYCGGGCMRNPYINVTSELGSFSKQMEEFIQKYVRK